jgi:hypothetical protein
MAPSPRATAWTIAALLASQLALAIPAAAQRSCFADEPVPGFVGGAVGLDDPGASRPLPAAEAGDYELCSDSAGFGAETDQLRQLLRREVGDFAMEKTLLSIDASGAAGLVARFDDRSADAAHVRITVHAVEDGFELRSGLRLDNGGIAVEVGQNLPVTLPVWLRIERIGTLVATAYSTDGVTYTGHFGIDTATRDLDRLGLVVGMVQASEGAGAQSAVFGEPAASGGEPRPDVQSCVDDFAIPTTGGREIELHGLNLTSVTGVSLAGVPAEIVSRSDDSLVVRAASIRPRAGPAPIRSGDVVVTSSHGPLALGAHVVYAGEPFVRADVDGDEQVTVLDLVRLLLALLDRETVSCLEAADVNADKRVDGADLVRLLRVLFLRGAPPPAPFPLPGFAPDGGRACGLPEGPVIRSVRRSQDAPESVLAGLPVRPRVREGDVLVIDGSGFPSDVARLAVRFGHVRTEMLPPARTGELRVRVLEVPSPGVQCPLVLQDSAERVPALGTATSATRFGVAHALVERSDQDDAVCPDFLASPLVQVNVARLRGDGASLFLPIDRASWDPSQPLRVSASLALPLVNGVSRGARDVSFLWRDLAQLPGAADYDGFLKRLAAKLARELNGGRASDGCGCDATAFPDDGGIVISPCDPVLTWDDNGTCCDPPHEDPGFPLTAPPPPLSTADSFQVMPSDCEDPGPNQSQRNRVWCEFEKVVRASFATGLPIWEGYVPLENLLEGPPGILNVQHPNDRDVATKSVMFSTDAFYEAVEHGYNIPCRAAARAYYCDGGASDWMPAFSAPQRVVKTFWLRDSKLPPSLDPDELYGYVDPNGVRQNLVGMHLAISTGGIFDYWTWSTFFAPRVVGEEHAVDGTALSWNDACTTGAIADQPAEIQGVWQSYFMCTEGAPGEDGCGNPWGPPNECVTSCNSCHVSLGKIPFPDKPPLFELAMAWFPTLTDSEISACYDEIRAANEEDGVELYKSMAPDECQ